MLKTNENKFDTSPSYDSIPTTKVSDEKKTKVLESFDNLILELTTVKDHLRAADDKFQRAEVSVLIRGLSKARTLFNLLF